MSSSVAAGRFASNMGQFIKFGMVGGSGTVVNLAVSYIAVKIALATSGITPDDPFVNLFGSAFHVRWYHVFQTIAFLVANTWNYQLNRMWTFKSVEKVSWLRGYVAFLVAGLGAYVVSLLLLTLFMNPNSPVGLPEDIFDNSTGLRTKFYWATAGSILLAMPINFIINKLWTFRSSPKAPVLVEHTEPA